MTRDDFIQLIDTYGASPDRWPSSIRADAETFMASSDEAPALLASMAHVDSLLDTLSTNGAVSAATLDTILSVPQQHKQHKRHWRWFDGADMDFSFILPRLAGMAAAGIIGFTLGLTGVVPFPANTGDDAVYDLTDMVFASVYEENI